MSYGTDYSIDQIKELIKTLNHRIKKQENQLKIAKTELKEKWILLEKVKDQFKDYSKQEKQMAKQFKQISEKLTKVKEEEYNKIVDVQQQQYEIKLIDYEVDKKACEKAPFTTKQQFSEYVEQDRVALNELQQIDIKKKAVKEQQSKKNTLTQKVEQIQPILQNAEKKLNRSAYQQKYYEYMLEDLKAIIQNKQTQINYLQTDMNSNKQSLEELNYNLTKLLANDLNFHKCVSKH